MQRLLFAVLVTLSGLVVAQDRERLSSTNVDVRAAFFFKAKDAAVQKLLPAGWELEPPATGAAPGWNYSFTLVENLASHDADGKPLPTVRGVIIAVPARKTADPKVRGAMIAAGGLMTEGNSPGPYGLYGPGQIVFEKNVHAAVDGKVTVEEAWDLRGTDGNVLQVTLHYLRAPPTRSSQEVLAFSALKPEFYRIYRTETATDVLRSAALKIDRIFKLQIKASGPAYSAVFDGSEQLLAVTSIPSYSRRIYLAPQVQEVNWK